MHKSVWKPAVSVSRSWACYSLSLCILLYSGRKLRQCKILPLLSLLWDECFDSEG